MLFAQLFFTTLALALPSSSDRIEILDIVGAPEVKLHKRGGKETTAQKGDMIFVGDEVETEARQVAHLQGFDGSEWKVGQNTRLKLEKQKPEKKNFSYWLFNLVKGSFWGKVTHDEKVGADGFRQKVISRNAAMGIRGTEYLMLSGDNEAEVDVLDGTVYWGSSDKFEPGSYVEVKKGEHAAFKGGAAGKPELNKLPAPELLKKYQLAWEDSAKASAESIPSIDNCRRQGKGWVSVDGNPHGKCKK